MLPLCSIQPSTRNLTPHMYANKHLKNIQFVPTILSICSLMVSSFSLSNICSTFFNNSVNRPFITMKVQGVTSTWLYDTGAAANCMSLSEFRKIPPAHRPPRLPTLFNLSTASAHALNIVGVYNLTFSVNGRSATSPVFVCSNLNQSAILGMDAIKKLGLMFSPNKNSNKWFQIKSQTL